ncbi:DNA helicase, UvrD/REP type [Metarhizium album ARSEF 1941]|uniref:DNA 3'-5' helicase n=1 Tax=Metarhizium album (strain ARSEF 1941) TaxID=1081103 RepID=A0A0B2X7P4_METAS|nr:DNA helicase, UvrD/REP type [Metarhizium album ARSEF 1941]KHO01748.1 DNA helicase, UvrD/REP type [Metarhizium album ARSEF 1941]
MDTPATEAILKSLNEAQRRAVTSTASTVAILAGPGSGKTHALTSRVVWLIQHEQYQPADVIVATFTVKAAREMKARIGERLGEECEKKIVLGTFHSIARRYLAAYGKRIGLNPKFGIADDGDSRAIIQRIVKRLDLRVEPAHARSWISKKKSKGATLVSRHNGKQPRENPALSECYAAYQDHLARSNLLDYDDLLVRCVELLQDHPSCVSNVQAVLIDEYQDTNGIQYDLMRLFAQTRQRITIVGDPDQSIYGWRSAEIKNLYRLLRDYPETDEISLEENYRSSQLILDMSLQVIQQDKKRYQKVLLPVHTKGTRPVLRRLQTSPREGEWIVSELRRVITMFGGALKNEDVAILLRSASLSRHIESSLGKAGISYRMIGGHKFYERKEIKILLDYLRVIHQPDVNDAVARIINVPRRGIGETTIKSLLEEAETSKISLWALLWRHCRGGRQATTRLRSNMEQKLNTELLKIISTMRQRMDDIDESGTVTLVDLIEQLLNQLCFKKYLEVEYQEDCEQRWANVQEFLSLANDFARDFSNAEEDEALPEIENVDQVRDNDILGKFLANVALASDAQSGNKEQDKTSQVTISTIHAAKGLEWPVVFVPSVCNGSIPHSRAEDMDEERRLLYVAMTRAKALLYLSCPLYTSQGFGNKAELSPFVSTFAGSFAQKGPSFDRSVVEGVGRILDRVIPSEKSIFDKMPIMFCPEDDRFPVDPFDPQDPDSLDPYDDYSHGKAPKKQKTQCSANNAGTTKARSWKPDYCTTMEQSSEFTMSSLPGFVSAGAHRTALAASGVEAETSRNVASKAGSKWSIKGTTNRRPDQRSLLGFVVSEPKTPSTVGGVKHAPTDFSVARYQAAVSRAVYHEARPSISLDTEAHIDREFAQHKIAGVKPIARPNVAEPTTKGPSAKQYACFSSSPTQQLSPEPQQEEHRASTIILQRPASILHPTTFTSMKPVGGVRRPGSLGPPPSMSRLQKPFKPLTVRRPQGPSGDSERRHKAHFQKSGNARTRPGVT